VLEGFDGAASVTGARPPRTKPMKVVNEAPHTVKKNAKKAPQKP
jgi:small conductance mechanosensitive channel